MVTPENYGYSFKETLVGQFLLTNLSANFKLEYILYEDNGCGSTIVSQGSLGKFPSFAVGTNNHTLTFSGLPDGNYYLKLNHEGQGFYPTLKLSNFANLELSILNGVKKVFGNCTDCTTPTLLACLLNKMNYYFFLKKVDYSPNVDNSYKCSMVSNIQCSTNQELFYGDCKDDLRYMISYLYLLMYNDRELLSDKENIYDYVRIRKYISMNINKLS